MARLADLLSVEEAQERILARFQPLPAEPCELRDALGRVLAETVASDISLPPFDNSSMDGFALRSADTVGASTDRPIRLRVIGEVAAGSQSTPRVASGECARIMTGAPIPEGADAVIPFEEVEEEDVEIVLRVRARTGACVRLAGNDVATGLEVLQHGTEIGSRQIGLLAAAGKRSVSVTRRPSVAVISTGDELVEPGQPLQQGQIYNSNSPMLAAAIIEAGGVPQVFHPSRDTVEALAESLSTVKRVRAELIITSGGASVGDFDYVKDVLADQGQIEFWRVRVRPGKPLILGELNGTTVIGLPGNPTSAMVTFELFVRPAIRRMLGADPRRSQVEVEVDDYIENGGGRRTFARVVLESRDGSIHARLSGPQDSAMLLPLAHANALLVIPEDREELRPGDRATALVWSF